MKLFLWDQSVAPVESRRLLKQAVLQYETAKRNRENNGGSGEGSLFVVGETAFANREFLIAETSRGKPFAVQQDGSPLPLQVSVTHTGSWWLCAVGERNVGIDAELRSRQIWSSLVRRICTEQERRWLGECGGDEEQLRQRLLWLWVRKEAYVKYLGTGLSQGLNTFSAVERGNEAEGFMAVDLSALSARAQGELEAAVYAPREKVEGIEWIEWK